MVQQVSTKEMALYVIDDITSSARCLLVGIARTKTQTVGNLGSEVGGQFWKRKGRRLEEKQSTIITIKMKKA